MNGVFDLGGTDGMGPVITEENEPVFRAEWEKAAFAMLPSCFRAGFYGIDQFRHGIEQMGGADYLLTNYYEHWTHSVALHGEAAGVIDPAELEKLVQYYRDNPDAPLLPIINYSGGTEVSGAILSNTTSQSIHPCGFAGPLPGMGAEIVDDEGVTLGSGVGELVLRVPSPGMPTTFWGEPERYRSTYWERWPGTWMHGDSVEIAADGGVWFIRGRSDDTLKIAGKRVGPAEIESIANGLDDVLESAAIGVPDPVKGEAIAVFLRLAPQADEDAVRAEVSSRLAEDLGKPLRPKAVLVVEDLPRTRSGKIMRRVVRAIHLGEDVANVSALESTTSLDAIREAR